MNNYNNYHIPDLFGFNNYFDLSVTNESNEDKTPILFFLAY